VRWKIYLLSSLVFFASKKSGKIQAKIKEDNSDIYAYNWIKLATHTCDGRP